MGSNTDAALALREGSEAGTQAEEEVEVAKPVAACEGSSVTEAAHNWLVALLPAIGAGKRQPARGRYQAIHHQTLNACISWLHLISLLHHIKVV